PTSLSSLSSMRPRPPSSTLFPYTTLFRSQTEAMGMADHVVLLNAGHIEQQGSAQDLYGQPNSVFTAGFIGSPPMMMIHSDHVPVDRKSTRLNSSHVKISYAVFCLKKKNNH